VAPRNLACWSGLLKVFGGRGVRPPDLHAPLKVFTKSKPPTRQALGFNNHLLLKLFKLDFCCKRRGVGPGLSPDPGRIRSTYDRIHLCVGTFLFGAPGHAPFYMTKPHTICAGIIVSNGVECGLIHGYNKLHVTNPSLTARGLHCLCTRFHVKQSCDQTVSMRGKWWFLIHGSITKNMSIPLSKWSAGV
jgi:hypothetical protein